MDTFEKSDRIVPLREYVRYTGSSSNLQCIYCEYENYTVTTVVKCKISTDIE